MMNKTSFCSYTNKIKTLCCTSLKVSKFIIFRIYHFILFNTNSLSIYILYLLSISLAGFGILKSLSPRTPLERPRNIDVFFTSVSAATVSSMLAVEMEVYSDQQLVVMTVLMFLGGEIFTSMLGLHLIRKPPRDHEERVIDDDSLETHRPTSDDRVEIKVSDLGDERPSERSTDLKYASIRVLGILVLVYLLLVQALGVASLLTYFSMFSSAENVLKKKGISTPVFSVFMAVSTFANCGFVPTDENLIAFRENSGMLLILIPQIVLGNTMFPPVLRLIIWGMRKMNKSSSEAEYLLENSREVGYLHLLPRLHSMMLVPTGLGFLFIGSVLYSSLDWYTTGLDGLNAYQKAVAVVFQCINLRHSGENVVDLSTVASAVLVFFIVMMYLPPYTSFVPDKDEEESPNEKYNIEGRSRERKRSKIKVVEKVMFSNLSYLAIFIVLVCITERKSIKQDPLNFSFLNIVFEVTSAYGNVGLSTGYGCDRQLKPDPKCVSKWYGLVAKWSDEGKILLILVMIFGKLKKFNNKGGRMWKLF